ncbi:hypothetical protein BGZ94_009402 [Podila epigama]|nr:hypothetical protein BGZ94_009402 [Podila epigama]
MFFGLTTPILYSSPFALVKYNSVKWNVEERTERLVMLLRLFLAELDPDLQAQLPPWTTEEDDENLEEGWIDDDDVCESKNKVKDKNGVHSPARQYFHHYRVHDHSFLVTKVIPLVFGAVSDKRASQTILQTLDQLFHHHNGGSALSMCISVKRVAHLESLLPKLSSLRRIEVHNIEDISEDILDKVIDWIKRHDERFGTLRELQIGGLTEYDEYDLSRDKFMIKLAQAIRALTVLDTKSWTEAWLMVDELPVEELERISLEYGGNQASSQGGKFLLRCKRLKILDLFVPTPDTFRPVAEYVSQAAAAKDGLSFSTLSLSPSRTTTMSPMTASVPPIERLYLSGTLNNLKTSVEDAAAAFASTLKILKATSITRHQTLVPSICWDGVFMPHLTELQLQHDIALGLSFSLLAKVAPNLTILKLLVNGYQSCGQDNNSVDGILMLSKLQVLQLLGVWPLRKSFIQGLAWQVTGLKILDIERCFGIELDETMETLSKMEYLWRLGWDLSDEDEDITKKWQSRAPRIQIGPIGWDEYYV